MDQGVGDRRERGRMETWYSRSSVRRSPRRTLAGFAPEDGLPFTPELVPVVRHPEVEKRGPTAIHYILTRALGDHLGFTEELENSVVVPVAQGLQTGRLFPWLGSAARLDAGRIGVDEAYHSLFSRDMLDQVERREGLRCVITSTSILGRLQARTQAAPPAIRPLVSGFFAVVSEVVVSGVLKLVPIDRRVAPTIRELVADHLRDEAAHQAYFSSIFPEAWSHLGDEERDFIGPSMAAFVRWFFEPKRAGMTSWLVSAGFAEGAARRIVEDVTDERARLASLRRGIAPLLQVLLSGGALAHPATADAFSQLECPSAGQGEQA